MTRSILLMLAFFVVAGVARAQSLSLIDQATSKTFTAAQLLADKAARDIEIADPVYKRIMSYRVISMADLLRDLKVGNGDYVQARAVDDFSVAIPATLLKEDAFLAIESAAAPWPKLPGGTTSAGPFYIVWAESLRRRYQQRILGLSLGLAHHHGQPSQAVAGPRRRRRRARRRSCPPRSRPLRGGLLGLPSLRR